MARSNPTTLTAALLLLVFSAHAATASPVALKWIRQESFLSRAPTSLPSSAESQHETVALKSRKLGSLEPLHSAVGSPSFAHLCLAHVLRFRQAVSQAVRDRFAQWRLDLALSATPRADDAADPALLLRADDDVAADPALLPPGSWDELLHAADAAADAAAAGEEEPHHVLWSEDNEVPAWHSDPEFLGEFEEVLQPKQAEEQAGARHSSGFVKLPGNVLGGQTQMQTLVLRAPAVVLRHLAEGASSAHRAAREMWGRWAARGAAAPRKLRPEQRELLVLGTHENTKDAWQSYSDDFGF